MYTFNLTLQDATGMIDALVFREDGTALFRVRPILSTTYKGPAFPRPSFLPTLNSSGF